MIIANTNNASMSPHPLPSHAFATTLIMFSTLHAQRGAERGSHQFHHAVNGRASVRHDLTKYAETHRGFSLPM